MFGSEAWSITSDMMIPWTDKVSNEEVLQRAAVCRKFICEIRTKQMSFVGHVLRKTGMENLALTGKMGRGAGEGNGCYGWLV